MNYGIAIFPSKSIQDDANSYRKRYDPHYSLIPPHITVKNTFQADEKLLEEITTELHFIAKDTKPFTIYMNKVSSFAPVANTIYFKVEQIQPLLELYERTHEGIFPVEEGHSFVPHITIAQGLTDDEFSDVLSSLKMKKIQYQDKIDRFHLLYQLDNGSWTVHDSFVFGL
ncbi:MAG TPA: YjcG family protein [Candidatus Avamphibacillus intestinigallinarum]|nr:YjcG family protein [Candidatus Avamphibacillus intestinigallinarum]